MDNMEAVIKNGNLSHSRHQVAVRAEAFASLLGRCSKSTSRVPAMPDSAEPALRLVWERNADGTRIEYGAEGWTCDDLKVRKWSEAHRGPQFSFPRLSHPIRCWLGRECRFEGLQHRPVASCSR